METMKAIGAMKAMEAIDHFVDLRSDTVTKPTDKMRQAMMKAEVGDDCYGEDPTVNELERLAAQKVGKEAAVFVPSGTMGNTAALMAHTSIGDQIIMDSECHIYYYEQGNYASIAGVSCVLTQSEDGCPDPNEVETILKRDQRSPKTSLICLENTHNRRGGRAISVEKMVQIWEVAKKYGVPVHLDGARIFNASIALKKEAKELAKYADSVMFCLSKGLSAPVGSLLTGNTAFIQKARRARKRLGGAMRQAGVLAAAGIVALTEMTDRLAEDHANAKFLAEGLSKLEILNLDPTKVETNMVKFDTQPLNLDAQQFAKKLLERKIKVAVYGPTTIRLVTNKDVSREDVMYAIDAIREVVKEIQ